MRCQSNDFTRLVREASVRLHKVLCSTFEFLGGDLSMLHAGCKNTRTTLLAVLPKNLSLFFFGNPCVTVREARLFSRQRAALEMSTVNWDMT